MKFLITGNRGFVGSETHKLCEKEGHTVIGYDLMEGFDIRDKEQLRRVVMAEKPDRILHLAAIARFNEADANPKLALESNALGTKNVAEVSGEFHIPMVYASTGSVYMPISNTPPITEEWEAKGNSVYGCTKYMGELYVKEFAHPWIILRYGHLYGREKRMHGLIGGYLERMERGVAPIRYGGAQSNDFCYIKDVAKVNFLALTAPWDKWSNVYNVGTGQEISATDAGDLVIEIYNKYNPENAFKGEVDQREARTVDPGRFVYDCKKARVMLGFTAQYDFKAGLDDMFKPEEK